jgi:DNA damage-binding protein 1
LFTLKREVEAESEQEQSRLVTTGAFHWGDFINVFCEGSLVMPQGSEDEAEEGADGVRAVPKLLFGTVGGGVGVLASLSWSEFQLLDRLQQAIASVVPSRNAEWRAFTNDRKTEPAKGFIDGDLVESLVDLPDDLVVRVVDVMNAGLALPGLAKVATDEPKRVSKEQIVAIVEALTRLH